LGHQGLLKFVQGLLERGIEAYRQGYSFAGRDPLSVLFSRDVDPDVHETAAFEFRERQKNGLTGPLAASSDEPASAKDFAYLGDFVKPFGIEGGGQGLCSPYPPLKIS
jgi:hypothetical protein